MPEKSSSDEKTSASDRLLIADCPECRKRVLAAVHGEVVEMPDEDLGRDAPREVVLAACTTCNTAMVLVSEFVWGPDEWESPENVWPNGARTVDSPYRVQRAFQEAYRCFHQANAYAATATMARRTLELVCNDQGASGSTLAKKIDWLKQNNKIEGRLFDWATALRFVGNDGAHGDAVGRQDAEDALALTEALLEHIYVLTVQYEKFSERRQAKLQAKTPTVPNPAPGTQGVTPPHVT
ncbi:DUF4145 domain-containing protein [Streptomyces microflavus]|uniref:DUF4145 domain-containing protein n=1 Tax=Streptomyces microflavus TaxID=1919 RepID=UPI00342C1895